MLGREIENVVFLGNTEIFEARKHMTFLLLLMPTYVQKCGEFNSSSLAELYLIFVGICSYNVKDFEQGPSICLWRTLKFSSFTSYFD